MKRFLNGVVSVTLKNGRVVTASWEKSCRDVHVTCYDSEFYGSESIDTSDFMVVVDAKWCLKKIIQDKGGLVVD